MSTTTVIAICSSPKLFMSYNMKRVTLLAASTCAHRTITLSQPDLTSNAKAFLAQSADQRIESRRPSVLLAATSILEIQIRVLFPNRIRHKATVARAQKIEVKLTFNHHFSE